MPVSSCGTVHAKSIDAALTNWACRSIIGEGGIVSFGASTGAGAGGGGAGGGGVASGAGDTGAGAGKGGGTGDGDGDGDGAGDGAGGGGGAGGVELASGRASGVEEALSASAPSADKNPASIMESPSIIVFVFFIFFYVFLDFDMHF